MSRVFTRREFLKTSAAAAGMAALASRAEAARAYSDEKMMTPGVAHLRIPHPRRFRILQITDLHFFAGKLTLHDTGNRRTIETMKKLVAKVHPNLLMVTGDLWPENRDGMAEPRMRYIIKQIEALGVPWAYTWGNHDQLPDFKVGHEAFTKAKNSLYRGADSDGNYVINLLSWWQGFRIGQIVCLNTHRDGVQKEQQEWLKNLAKTDPGPLMRLAFFHIPLKQYEDIWNSGEAIGVIGENSASEKEDGSTFTLLKSMGVIACFCGHDHANDYSGELEDVDLVYGRATGAGGYGGAVIPKGGKFITVNCIKEWQTWISLTPDGKRWRPKPGERIDKRRKKD
ncbi:MAG TPA: metallophosphoesterase [Candidatus Hydrogenedentes bacterium]|nr:metallophosphoesterase [Candidatus Hydrogenedentota bacterium]